MTGFLQFSYRTTALNLFIYQQKSTMPYLIPLVRTDNYMYQYWFIATTFVYICDVTYRTYQNHSNYRMGVEFVQIKTFFPQGI